MFYTKYRPQKFSDISKPNEAADALSKEVLNKKTAHAYLFVGPRGTGKTSTARILAKALNCEKLDKKGDPCNECISCLSIQAGSYTDLIEIDAASNRGIDDIRDLQDKMNLSPSMGKHKVYIIDEVHMLTPPAFNALLKTLEEPPKNVTFILCTTEVHKVPETIKSRCQVFRFKRATISQLTTKLAQIAEKEGAIITKESLRKIAGASLGGFRDAETLLQQIIEGEIEVDALLGSFNKETLVEFTSLLIQKDIGSSLSHVNRLYDDGIDLFVWSGELLKYFRDLLYIKSKVFENGDDYSADIFEEITSQANSLPYEWLCRAQDTLMEAQQKIKKAFIPSLPLEIFVVNICEGASSQPVKQIPVITIPPVLPKKETPVKMEKPEKIAPAPKPEEKIPVAVNTSVNMESTVLEQKWTQFLERMKIINGPILAILNSSKILGVQDGYLMLEVYFAFHKERLESTKNRKIVEELLLEIYEMNLGVKCVLATEKPQRLKKQEVGILTDVNVVPVDMNSIMQVLDGGLPL